MSLVSTHQYIIADEMGCLYFNCFQSIVIKQNKLKSVIKSYIFILQINNITCQLFIKNKTVKIQYVLRLIKKHF